VEIGWFATGVYSEVIGEFGEVELEPSKQHFKPLLTLLACSFPLKSVCSGTSVDDDDGSETV
jgi:hypothetical protein